MFLRLIRFVQLVPTVLPIKTTLSEVARIAKLMESPGTHFKPVLAGPLTARSGYFAGDGSDSGSSMGSETQHKRQMDSRCLQTHRFSSEAIVM